MIWPQGAYPLPRSHSQGQICTPHLLTILTKHACHHNSFWGSRCDSNHVPTISLKTGTLLQRFRHTFSAYDTSLIKAYPLHHQLVTTHDISSYFGLISYKIFTFWLIPTKTNLSRLATQNILKQTKASRCFRLR